MSDDQKPKSPEAPAREIALKVHELVRDDAHRRRFRRQVEAFVPEAAESRQRLRQGDSKGTPPWAGRTPSLAAKCAVLAELHDRCFPDAPILERAAPDGDDDAAWWASASAWAWVKPALGDADSRGAHRLDTLKVFLQDVQVAADPTERQAMSEKTTESSKAQDIARKVGSLLAPHQDVLRECRGEFEALLKDEEADWERRCNACANAEEREALDRERAEKEPLRPWLRRERPFAVRVMRLALLHDDTLPKASRLLGSPEDDSPHIAVFRQDFRLEVSGVADADEMFRVAYSDDQLPAWDGDVLDGLRDDLRYVEAELDVRTRQAAACPQEPAPPASADAEHVPDGCIPTPEVIKRWWTSRTTLKRKRDTGALTGYRPPDAPGNAPVYYAPDDLDNHFPRRKNQPRQDAK